MTEEQKTAIYYYIKNEKNNRDVFIHISTICRGEEPHGKSQSTISTYSKIINCPVNDKDIEYYNFIINTIQKELDNNIKEGNTGELYVKVYTFDSFRQNGMSEEFIFEFESENSHK